MAILLAHGKSNHKVHLYLGCSNRVAVGIVGGALESFKVRHASSPDQRSGGQGLPFGSGKAQGAGRIATTTRAER